MLIALIIITIIGLCYNVIKKASVPIHMHVTSLGEVS